MRAIGLEYFQCRKRLIEQKHLHHLLPQPDHISDSTNTLRNLLDVTIKHLSAFRVLQLPIEHWDAIIVYVVSKRLSNNIRQTWEIECCDISELPSWQSL